MKPVLALLALVLLAGCVKYRMPDSGVTYARLGETIYVGGPSVTPVELLEDSRCAPGTQCVWEGRLRLRVTLHGYDGDRSSEMTLGQTVQVNRGALSLARVQPAAQEGTRPFPEDYRFGFIYDGKP